MIRCIICLLVGGFFLSNPLSDDRVIRSFHYSKSGKLSSGMEMAARNQALITASYYTAGFDFKVSLVGGTTMKKMTSSGMIKDAEVLDPVKIAFGPSLIVMNELKLPKEGHIPSGDERKACVEKTVTVCLSEEEFKTNINSALALEALALIYLERFRNPFMYRVEGHAWLVNVSKPEVVEKNGKRFLKTDVTLLVPASF
jgi:hypothetical protein